MLIGYYLNRDVDDDDEVDADGAAVVTIDSVMMLLMNFHLGYLKKLYVGSEMNFHH